MRIKYALVSTGKQLENAHWPKCFKWSLLKVVIGEIENAVIGESEIIQVEHFSGVLWL